MPPVAAGTVLLPSCPSQLDLHHVTGTTTILPHSPMAGEGSQRWQGSAWKGAAQPPNTPLAHPSQKHMSKALAAHGGGSAGLAGADEEVTGL